MRIRITWECGGTTGWQICGSGLARAFAKLGHEVELAAGVRADGLAPWEAADLAPLLGSRGKPDLTLVALGNDFQAAPGIRPAESTGLVFAETLPLPPESLERAKGYRTLIAGSSWLQVQLAAQGLRSGLFLQGVDCALFCPGPKPDLFPGRYVVFSGGKFEPRKGQDIVLDAFRRFLKVRPDAFLLTHWYNAWPQSMQGIDKAGLVKGVPRMKMGPSGYQPDIHEWVVDNGIPPDAHVEIGRMAHYHLPYYLRRADVAVFPNRVEGGTNLVAMEALAVGIPCLIANQTGHLDLPIAHEWTGNIRPVVGEWWTMDAMRDWTWERAARQILDHA